MHKGRLLRVLHISTNNNYASNHSNRNALVYKSCDWMAQGNLILNKYLNAQNPSSRLKISCSVIYLVLNVWVSPEIKQQRNDVFFTTKTGEHQRR